MLTKENFGGMSIADMLVAAGLAKTKSEARRLVMDKAIRINDRLITDPTTRIAVVGNEMFILENE
jgi:ribosomal protein S4